jgi:hypothetical protein
MRVVRYETTYAMCAKFGEMLLRFWRINAAQIEGELELGQSLRWTSRIGVLREPGSLTL